MTLQVLVYGVGTVEVLSMAYAVRFLKLSVNNHRVTRARRAVII